MSSRYCTSYLDRQKWTGWWDLNLQPQQFLQAVDGIALKRAVDSWVIAPAEEKMAAFRVAEGIRWTEEGTHSIYRILQGTVAIVFGVAIVKSVVLSRWMGAVGIAAGVEVAYVGFASVNVELGVIAKIIYYIWIGILGAFMWRKTILKKGIVAR